MGKRATENFLDKALADLENQKQEAFKKADEAYYDSKSGCYKDNERYCWAITTINRKFNQLREDLILKSYETKSIL